MSSEFDVAVIGGGIAGISAAAEISCGASVVVLERESQPGYHASGRSAAILAQNYGTPPMQALTALAEPFLAAPPPGFCEAPLLSPRGMMRIARPDQLDAIRALAATSGDFADLVWLSGPEAEARAPLLRPGHIARAFINEAAADIDVHALIQGYLRQARAAGAELRLGAEVREIRREGARWRIVTGAGEVLADTIVNAAGAWADQIAQRAGLRPLGLTPMRRSAITVAAPQGLDVAALPMIVDTDEAFYVKPEAGRLMASPGDESPSQPCDAQPEELDVAICVDRISQACRLDVRRIESKWAGLRTFAPDRLPVCGPDPAARGFLWLAGQGGVGVQTSPALSRIAAAMVLGSPLSSLLGDSGLKLEALAPGRPALAA